MRLLLLLLLITNLLFAQKFALVIGNADYSTGWLPNPKKDANLIARSLRAVGFSVEIQKDIHTAPQMKGIINNFARKLDKNDIAVVYYAGHGVQCKGKNYLIPTKADIVKGGQLATEALDLDFLIAGVSEIKLAMVMLDACRNNTYPSCNKSQSRGLVQPSVPQEGGMILSFARAENEIASDGDKNHSPYALALSKYMKESIPIETYFRKVGGEVYRNTGLQRPMLKNSFYGEFSFLNQNIPSPKYSLTINSTPSHAKIYMMHIQPSYKKGMKLKKGTYNIKVMAKGYKTKIVELYINADMSENIVLEKEKTTSDKDIVSIGNLMWENQEFTKKYTHKEAIKYCQNLSLGGYRNWRLPTKKELHTLMNIKGYGESNYYYRWQKWFDKNKHKRVINSKGESHFIKKEFLEKMPEYSWFWTADKEKGLSSSFWIVGFSAGHDLWYNATDTRFVRCVRQ